MVHMHLISESRGNLLYNVYQFKRHIILNHTQKKIIAKTCDVYKCEWIEINEVISIERYSIDWFALHNFIEIFEINQSAIIRTIYNRSRLTPKMLIQSKLKWFLQMRSFFFDFGKPFIVIIILLTLVGIFAPALSHPGVRRESKFRLCSTDII